MNTLKRAGLWGCGLAWLGATVHAQTPEAAPPLGSMTITAPAASFRQFDKVEITGSAILAKEARQALPIQVLTQRDIAQSGATDLSTFLQRLPVMQNFTDSGMATGTSLGGPETAAIHGNQSGTLVLLNGRRLPYYGSQTIIGERAVVDLNFIPLSAVEKIEILTDGASTRYGSDAVAGVVNVVTRSRMRGLTLNAETTLPFLPGGVRKTMQMSWGSGAVERDGYSLRAHWSLSHQEAVLAGWRSVAQEGATPFTIDARPYWSLGSNVTLASTPARNYRDTQGRLRNTFYDAHGRCEPDWYELNTGVCLRNAQRPMTLYPEQNKHQLFVQGERVLGNGWLLFADAVLAQQTQTMVPRGTYYRFVQQGTGPVDSYLMEGSPWGLLQQRYDTHLQHMVAGLKGELAGWDFSASLSHGTHWVERQYNAGLVKTGYHTVQVLPQEIGLDPALYSQATTRLFSQYADPNSLLLDAGKTTLHSASLLLSRPWPGNTDGPVHVGLGLDGRQELVWYAPGPAASSSLRPAWDGARSIWAAHGEVQWQASERLETTASVRHDHYSDFGGVRTGKLGWKFRATERSWWRGSVGTGFRAPPLGEMVPKQTYYLDHGGYRLLSQGNPELKPERSHQWTLGLHLEPSRQWGLGADLWSLDIRNTFGVLSPRTILASDTLKSRYESTDSTGIRYLATPNINLGQSVAQGVDYYLRLRQPVDAGRWQLALHGTWTHQSMQDIGQGMVSNLGRYTEESRTFVPRHQWSWVTSFERLDWRYSAALHHRSGHLETAELRGMDGSAISFTHRVAGWTTLDLMALCRWDKHWEFRAALVNVANRLPAFTLLSTNAIHGVDTRSGDYLGRRLQLQVQYRF